MAHTASFAPYPSLPAPSWSPPAPGASSTVPAAETMAPPAWERDAQHRPEGQHASQDADALPFLGGLAALLRWLEALAALISGPFLLIGLGIALIDLLTDGQLLAAHPVLLLLWALSQAAGVDAQLLMAWDEAHRALQARRWAALLGYLVLGVALAYVGWVAAQVFAVQQAQGISTATALAQLGMNATDWLVQRSALAVVLVCLSGWLRSVQSRRTPQRTRQHPSTRAQAAAQAAPPAPADRSAVPTAPIASAGGLPAVGISANGISANGITADQVPTVPGAGTLLPPTGPAPRSGKGTSTQQRLRAQREAAVTAWLASEPGISTRELARRLEVSESTASELRHVVEARGMGALRIPTYAGTPALALP